MIAEVGGIRNVSGRRMATPFAPPSPGRTPMMVPSVIPSTAISRLKGVMAIWKPWMMFSKPMSVTQPGFDGSLRQRHEKPPLEQDEGDDRERDGDAERRYPRMPPHGSHVEPEVQRGGDVEAEELGEQHQARGWGGDGEDRAQLLARGERFVGVLANGAHDDRHAVPDEDQREPEGKETALRPIRPPAETEPDRFLEDDEPEQGQQGRRNDVRAAHPLTWEASRPWPSTRGAASRSRRPTSCSPSQC